MSLKLWELDTLQKYRILNPDGYFLPIDTSNCIEYNCVAEWVFSDSPELCITDFLTWGIILNTEFEVIPPANETKDEIFKKLSEIRDTLVNGKPDRFSHSDMINKLDYCTSILKKV